jgi:uncharacterized protein (TIGR02145 family)
MKENAAKTGFDVTCGETKGTILHGDDCTITENEEKTENVITCGATSQTIPKIDVCNGVAYKMTEQGCTDDGPYAFCSTIKTDDCACKQPNGKLAAVKSGLTCEENGQITGTMQDSRDNNKEYKIVKIGTQVWMAENLDYNLNATECDDTYGCYYTWTQAMNGSTSSTDNPSGVQGICPPDWHLPSDAEWTQLTEFVGSETAGTQLIAWGDGTNAWGFSALPGGYYAGSSFYFQGSSLGSWRSASENDAYTAWYRNVDANAIVNRGSSSKSDAFSVRCVKD